MIDLSEIAGVELQADKISDKKYLKKTGIYTAELSMAYMKESKNGAIGIQLDFTTEEGETYAVNNLWVTNRKGEPFYIIQKGDKKGEKDVLPGMKELMKYSQLLTGKKESFNETEDTIYPIYDKEKGAMVDKTVKSVPSFVGKIVQLVLQETVKDKTALNSGSGKYDPTGETMIVLELKTLLDGVTGKTLAEVESGSEAGYKNIFLKKIVEEPIYVPKGIVGRLPASVNSKDSGEHKPKVNADDTADAAPFGQ